MKMLMTGFSRQDCGGARSRQSIDRLDMYPMVTGPAQTLGELEHRRVRVGEDLSGYDLLIVCMNKSLSFNATWGNLGVFWAVTQGLPTLLWHVDWQLRPAIQDLKTTLRHPHYLTKKVKGELFHKGEDEETIVAYHDWLMHGVRILSGVDGGWPAHWRVLLQAMPWGLWDVFENVLPMRPGQYVCADPGLWGLAHFDLPEWVPTEERTERWLLPSLSPQDKWAAKLDPTWPVYHLGSKKLKADRVTEQTVIEMTGQSAGVLSPPYPSLLGAGWWRFRYDFAAAVGTPIVSGENDVGLGRELAVTVKDVEAMDFVERHYLALAQREKLLAGRWTPEQLHEFVRATLSWAAESGRMPR